MYELWIHKTKPGRGIDIIIVLTTLFLEEQSNYRLIKLQKCSLKLIQSYPLLETRLLPMLDQNYKGILVLKISKVRVHNLPGQPVPVLHCFLLMSNLNTPSHSQRNVWLLHLRHTTLSSCKVLLHHPVASFSLC